MQTRKLQQKWGQPLGFDCEASAQTATTRCRAQLLCLAAASTMCLELPLFAAGHFDVKQSSTQRVSSSAPRTGQPRPVVDDGGVRRSFVRQWLIVIKL